MLSMLRRLGGDPSGATAIEYTLIACLIALAAIVGMGTAGSQITGALSNLANTMQ